MNNDEVIITFPYSQANMDYAHAEAIKEDQERAAEVVQVMPSGLVITRGMLDEEIRAGKAFRPGADRNPMIVGLNASSNMFA